MELYRLCDWDKTFILCIAQKRIVYATVTNEPKVAVSYKGKVYFLFIID